MNPILGAVLIAAAIGYLVLHGLAERRRRREFTGPAPTGDPVEDYHRELRHRGDGTASREVE